MKKLIPTVALALMGAAAVSGSTYAWFSMNKSVEATGMKVKATTSGALVIGTNMTTYDIAANFNESAGAHVLSHSTHDDDFTSYPNGLKTISSEDEVNPVSGEASTTTWSSAVNPDAAYAYYVDYSIYLASGGTKIENKDIVMTMTDEMKQEVEKNWGYNMSAKTKGMADTLFGFTVDVYSKGSVDATTDADATMTFKATYHLDNENAELKMNLGTIPSSIKEGTEEDPVGQGIHLVLRVYLDGEYAKKTANMEQATGTADGKTIYFNKTGDGATANYTPATVSQGADVSSLYKVGTLAASSGKYVHTEKANTSDLSLGFKFEAVDHAA